MRKTQLLVTVGSIAMIAGPAFAQSSTNLDQGLDANDVIIVTAGKRVETVQTTTESVSVVTGEQLTKSGKASLDDVLRDLPNTQVSSSGGGNVFIRGVGSTSDTIDGRDQAVVINFDGVAQTSGRILNSGLFDVQRVEVLAGPQGTLYGKNATGGVINLVSVVPGDELAASGNLQVGNYNAIRAEGGVTLPVGEGFAVRLAGLYDKHDGYGTDGINAVDNWAMRVRPRVEIGETISILGTFEYRNEGATPPQPYPLPSLATNDPWDHGFTGVAGIRDNDIYNAILELKYEGDWGTVTLLPAYNRTHFYQQIPNPIPTEFPIPQFVTTPTSGINQQRSFEGRVESPADAKLEWMVGVYYLHQENDRTSEPARLGINPACVGTTICDPILVLPNMVTPSSNPAKSYAAFAQIAYPLTDTVKARAGIRYTHDKKMGDYTDASGSAAQYDLAFKNVSWSAALEWTPRPTSLIYLKAASGYKAGGANIPDQVYAASTAITKYDPEKLYSYTLGAKNTFLGGRVTINAEAYYYDYKNFQFGAVAAVPTVLGASQNVDCSNAIVGPFPDPTSTCVSFSYTGNAPGSKAYGADFTIIAKPSSADTISLNLSLQHTKFGEFTYSVPGQGAVSFKGDSFLNAPKIAAVIGYDRRFEFASGAAIDLGGRLSVSSKYNSSFDYRAFPVFTQPAYEKLDLHAGFTPASGNWSLRAYARNVTKTAVVQSGSPLGIFLNDPRVYGMSFAFDF